MTAPLTRLIARPPTPVEITVIVAIVGVLLGLLLSPNGLPTPIGDSQLDFARWDASVEKPPRQELHESIAIEGEWADQFRRMRFSFTRKPDGTLTVQFYSSGRCGLGGCVELSREAVLADGVITLNRPVQTLFGDTFQRLYAVGTDEMPLLIPSVYVDQLSECQSIATHQILARVPEESRVTPAP